jgi:ComF family protein
VLTRIAFQKSTQSLLNLLFPPRCVVCKASDSWLCQPCLSQIPLIHRPICQRCGTPLTSSAALCRQCQNHPLQFIAGIRSASYFDHNPIRPAIHFLKYRNHQAVAAALAQLLADAYRRFQLNVEVIVPIPLHTSRLRERGYNQCELLARQLSLSLNLPVNTTSLQRVRHTKSQMTLSAVERHQNLAGAFACRDVSLAGRRVLLIDDVCTTGTTLDACAEALAQSGAASVWGLTLAKAS